ncbi:hypothetical protein ACFPN2_34760 [Steroidobacter flavus]|uniref:Uncharacterized protein n=1 Tax=Steroidobacter flavus TaxID=1842136 RepID=A0ABV8T3P1_9GAMM
MQTPASAEPQKCTFHIAAFGVDGSLVGMDMWSSERLSGQWLAICREYLNQHGSSFDEPWSGKLSHIRTKLTAARGAALVTFSAHGRIVSSLALASGASQVTEKSVLEMFVNSLRQTQLVRVAARTQEPFQQVLQIAERPVMIVVPWADEAISEQDHTLVRELSIHLAAAFFLRPS